MKEDLYEDTEQGEGRGIKNNKEGEELLLFSEVFSVRKLEKFVVSRSRMLEHTIRGTKDRRKVI